MRTINRPTTLSLHIITPFSSPVNYTVEIFSGIIATGIVNNTNSALVVLSVSLVTESSDYDNRNKGILVSSDSNEHISVIVVHRRVRFVGAYLAYPYLVYPINEYQYYIASIDGIMNVIAKSEVLLVGNVDDTTVTITPTLNINVPQDIQNSTSPNITYLAGTSFTVTLHRLQTFLLRPTSPADLIGTSIVSNKPLSVISSNECTERPLCQHLVEQIPPTITWGK